MGLHAGFVVVVVLGGGEDGEGAEGFGDVVHVGGGSVDALERGEALAVVVVEVEGAEVAFLGGDEVDGFGGSLGVVDGLLEGFGREDGAVDAEDLDAGG